MKLYNFPRSLLSSFIVSRKIELLSVKAVNGWQGVEGRSKYINLSLSLSLSLYIYIYIYLCVGV